MDNQINCICLRIHTILFYKLVQFRIRRIFRARLSSGASNSGQPHPRWQLESCVSPGKIAHDVKDRLEIVPNPTRKLAHDVMDWQAISQKCVSSLTPGFRVRILRPSEKENPTISTHHKTSTTITHHVQPWPYYSNNELSDNHNSRRNISPML